MTKPNPRTKLKNTPATSGDQSPRRERLLAKPVIPVLSRESEEPALGAAAAVFIQGTTLGNLGALVAQVRATAPDAAVLVHIDLIQGLANDEAGVEFLADLCPVDGIVTIRHHLADHARRQGLLSVVRFFLQDTRALERALAVIRKSRPDAVELLPAVAAASVGDSFAGMNTPRIAGGLVRDSAMVETVLASGCRAVTSTNPALWRLNEARQW
jgi:glycerol uptake operon antiterminator